MAMTNDEWDALVLRRVQQAKSDPRGYRIRVGAWALTGYAVLLGALGAALAGVAGIAAAIVLRGAPVIALKLAIPIGLLVWIIGRSLAVKIPPPAGLELKPTDSPVLFDTIARLRERLDTPPLHHVLLDGDFNASVVQIPRLGPLGWQRNYLTLGLATLQALSREELEAVLAHELGHISRSHGRFGVWVYRLRRSWGSVARQLDDHGFAGAGVARRFLRWYVPRLQACTVALVREHEHEADRASADAVGAAPAALALVRCAALAPAVGGYWDAVFRRVLDDPAAPRDAYSGLREALRCAPPASGEAALRQALATPTETTDSHPSLSERLAALGCSPDALPADAVIAPATSAADALLRYEVHLRLSERLSGEWYEAVQAGWAERHAEAADERARLEGLQARAASGSLDVESARERAELVGVLDDGEAVLAAWRDVLALDPADARAHLAVGVRLLAADDDAGLAHLDRAIEASPLMAVHAADAGYGYLAARGRDQEAARYRARSNHEYDVLAEAAEERRDVRRSDALEPHGLAPEPVAAVASALARIGHVRRAYVARKRVAHLADDAPVYVIGVERRTAWWRLESGAADARLARQVADEVALPGEVLAVALARPTGWLRKRLKRVDGALIYGR